MPRPVHFELSAEDPERALGFYKEVFGWKAEKSDGPMPYWHILTGPKDEPGIDGGLLVRSEMTVQNCNTMEVPSVDDYIAKITAAGGKIVVPKMEIPGIGFMAYCTDTEGNWFGIIEFAKK